MEALEVLPTPYLKALARSIEGMLQSEVESMLATGDPYVLNYRRGRAAVLKELLGYVRGILSDRGSEE